MRLSVPIALIGRAAGQAEGGLVQHQLHELEIEVLPKHLPEHIEVDVTNLGIGDSVHVSDLSLENVTILTSESVTIVSVTAPRVATDDEAADAEAGPDSLEDDEAPGKKGARAKR